MDPDEFESDMGINNSQRQVQIDTPELFDTPESEDELSSDSDDLESIGSESEPEQENVVNQLSQVSISENFSPLPSQESNNLFDEDDAMNIPEQNTTDVVWDWVSGTALAQQIPLPFDRDGTEFIEYSFMEPKELNFFQEFFTPEILNLIVSETNKQHQRLSRIPRKCSNRMLDFKKVSGEDILRLIAVRICMGLDRKPRQIDYWSQKRFYKSDIVPRIMTVDRYKEVLRYLHFCDNDQQDEGDRLFKISELLRLLTERTELHIVPGKNLCVDESLVLFKGKLYFKQFIPTKAARFGIKIFELADSETGYIIKPIVYHGAGHEFKYSIQDYGFGGAVALELSERYINAGRCIYMDNYFNNVRIAKHLLNLNTNMCGTLKKRLKFNPPMQDKIAKNIIHTYSSNGVLVERWKDKREVRMISTGHPDIAVTTRKYDKEIIKPETAHIYTKYARSIDRADQIIGAYDMLRKSMKWYKKLFFHFVDVMLYNACIMYSRQHGRISIKEFKENVVNQILLKYGEHITKRGRKTSEASLQSQRRLVERHFPSYVPATTNNKTPTKNCVVCRLKSKKRTQTRYMCDKCNVGLCAANCFKIHHEILNYKAKN